MAKFRNKDWWLGRTDEQQQRKQAARQQWGKVRGKSAGSVSEGDSQAVLDRFYELQGAIEQGKRERDFDVALQLAARAAASLGGFVAAWNAEEEHLAAGGGEELPGDWFRIKSIVAVDTICDLAPARRDDSTLRWLREQLAATPELAPWIARVDEALADVDAAHMLVAEIEREPGIEQAGLAKKLGLDGQRVRSILYWMEQDGTVSRQKSGRSYWLYLTERTIPDA